MLQEVTKRNLLHRYRLKSKVEVLEETLTEAKNLISELVDEMRMPLVKEVEEVNKETNSISKEVEDDPSTSHDENIEEKIEYCNWDDLWTQMKPNFVSQKEESLGIKEISMKETKNMENEVTDEVELTSNEDQSELHGNKVEIAITADNGNSMEKPESYDSTEITSGTYRSGKIKVSNLEEAKSKILELTTKTDFGFKCTVCNYASKLKSNVGQHM